MNHDNFFTREIDWHVISLLLVLTDQFIYTPVFSANQRLQPARLCPMFSLLTEFFTEHERIFVLTGAGVSTASGIPDYRDDNGDWKHQQPMEYHEFVERHAARQRYWARSFIGWQRFNHARPNRAHQALARLEQLRRLTRTVTQNVDGLHQRAGSRRLTELHGSLATVVCLVCGAVI